GTTYAVTCVAREPIPGTYELGPVLGESCPHGVVREDGLVRVFHPGSAASPEQLAEYIATVAEVQATYMLPFRPMTEGERDEWLDGHGGRRIGPEDPVMVYTSDEGELKRHLESLYERAGARPPWAGLS